MTFWGLLAIAAICLIYCTTFLWDYKRVAPTWWTVWSIGIIMGLLALFTGPPQ